MTLYRAYGLDISSSRPLPLRPAQAGAEPDLVIDYEERALDEPPSGPDRRNLVRTDDGWTLRYDNREGGWMAFDYSAARRRLRASGSVDWTAMEGPLTGLVFGVIHRIEGESPLHGAGLRFGDRAVAILGGSGHGKSTLAAASVASGSELLTEDLLLLRRADAGYAVEPGAPTLHLLGDSFRHLASRIPEGNDPVATNGDGKVRLIMPHGPPEPARLSAIYILEPPSAGGGTGIERLTGPSAIGSLAEQLYGSRWVRPADARDLAFCARIAAEVPIHALARPWALASVFDTAERLRAHALAG